MVLDLVAVDTETTGVGWYDKAFMISVADANGSDVYDSRIMSNDEWIKSMEIVSNTLHSCDKIVMHNAKFDMQKLIRLGINSSVF